MKRSKSAFFQEKNSFTAFMKGSEKLLTRISYFLAALIIALIIGGISLHANANPTDWHDNELSQQIQQETRCEQKGGVFENGVCLPPNLTLAAEKELQDYTAQKQAEINRTLGEKQ
ncbi:TPA: hypothetical protein ACPQYU_000427 [Haemophilus influenzae]|uniref:hypothetical protein n=1 Tax=Haemophilus influenzae TaxID=727 RepID=UPI000C33CFA3|nr:hypothetical protein [Haemophilus influenzae]PKF66402.1 hypothetical protein CW355_06930 [Haemophilus influenzae]PRI63421.1 hypothetical protein BVZ87_00884 [Haemophilus influenzae]